MFKYTIYFSIFQIFYFSLHQGAYQEYIWQNSNLIKNSDYTALIFYVYLYKKIDYVYKCQPKRSKI